LVALSLVHLKNNDFKLIPELFKYFNSESDFHVNDDYQKVLFFIAEYHYLIILKGQGVEARKTTRQYLELVRKTGFSYFTETFLINYFN
jgi:hypothetical protein